MHAAPVAGIAVIADAPDLPRNTSTSAFTHGQNSQCAHTPHASMRRTTPG